MKNSKNLTHKSGIVPMCPNTAHCPLKTFSNIPTNGEERKKWCKTLKKDERSSPGDFAKNDLHSCEDHFNVS